MDICRKICLVSAITGITSLSGSFYLFSSKPRSAYSQPLTEPQVKKIEAPKKVATHKEVENNGVENPLPIYQYFLRNDLPPLTVKPGAKGEKRFVPDISRTLPRIPDHYSRARMLYLKAAHAHNLHGKYNYYYDTKAVLLEYSPVKSYEVLSRLPFDAMIDRLGLKGRESIQILYPGAGVHIAALEIGIQLQRRLPNLKTVRFVFTETHHKNSTVWPEAHFETLVSLMGPNVKILGKTENKLNAYGTKRGTKFEILAFGRKMEVTYAINLSEKSDHPYFRKKYVQESDIVLFHDSFGTGWGKCLV